MFQKEGNLVDFFVAVTEVFLKDGDLEKDLTLCLKSLLINLDLNFQVDVVH